MRTRESADAVIRVYHDAGNVIGTQQRMRFKSDFLKGRARSAAFELLNARPCVDRFLPGKLEL